MTDRVCLGEPAGSRMIDIPMPPSVNNLFANLARGGRRATLDYRMWRQAAGWILKAERMTPIVGPYALTIRVPLKMRGDIDNRIKAVSDLFVASGITPDDSLCHRLLVDRDAAVPSGRIYCAVEEVRV